MSEQHLRQMLEQLHTELQRADTIDERSRELLRSVLRDIEDLLERKQERGTQPESIIERLREAVSAFEETHPTLTYAIGGVADALARMDLVAHRARDAELTRAWPRRGERFDGRARSLLRSSAIPAGSTRRTAAPMDREHASREELLRDIERLQRRIEHLESGGAAPGMRSIIGLVDKVIQLSEDDRIEYVNRALAKMAGVVRDDVIGEHLSVIDRFPWGEGLLTTLLANCRARGGEVAEEMTTVDGTGRRQYFKVIVNVASGKPQILIEDTTVVKVLENTFKRYVSPTVIQRMIAAQREKDFFMAERYEMTVLFCDLRGFAAMSEGMCPEEVRSMINEYLTAMTDVILRHEGTLDKFVGDGVMALFGAPLYYPDHAIRALRVALDMQGVHRGTQTRWRAQGRPTPGVGIGINTGEMVVGNMGSPLRVNYSALGHHVNLAARLCSRALAGEILLGERTFALVEGAEKAGTLGIAGTLTFERRGNIAAKGISTPVGIVSVAEREPEPRSSGDRCGPPRSID